MLTIDHALRTPCCGTKPTLCRHSTIYTCQDCGRAFTRDSGLTAPKKPRKSS